MISVRYFIVALLLVLLTASACAVANPHPRLLLSPEDVEHLLAAGIKHIDVAGTGGTSWSMVESRRSTDPDLGELFADWGIPTPIALKLMKQYLL